MAKRHDDVIEYQWKNGVMIPTPKFQKLAARLFKEGDTYRFPTEPLRVGSPTGAFFKDVATAWENLDDETTSILRTPNHLRRWALIQAGWCRMEVHELDSKDDAMRMAVFARKRDDYAEIKVRGNQLLIKTAMSQRSPPMEPEDVRQSQRDVRDILSGKISVSRATLERESKLRGANQAVSPS